MSPTTTPLGTAELGTWVSRLAVLLESSQDAERIERIRILEEVKAACAAAQARETAAFARSQRAVQEAAGVRAADRGRGIGAQVALARRESVHRGGRLLGLAEALVAEMPRTLEALERGQTSEWRATIVARETACLAVEDRTAVDTLLAERLPGLGDREVEVQARAAAYRLDPHAFVARTSRAERDRTVTTRPAPDTMCRLSALLPVAAGVAAYAALKAQADSLTGTGDERSRGQIMADTLVERLTGSGARVPSRVTLDVLLTDRTLVAGDREPAHLDGYGPIPAPLARRIAADPEVEVALRRLYTRPGDGRLVAMESAARLFPEGLRRFLVFRDQNCRTPWCGAPIRHADHVTAYADGGPTTAANGQGLCVACNQAKEAPGWSARTGPDGAADVVTTTTPTGHEYRSEPPPLPGSSGSAGRAPATRRPFAEIRTRRKRRRTRAGTRVVFVHVARPAAPPGRLGPDSTSAIETALAECLG